MNSSAPDLLIRGGSVVDGTGAPREWLIDSAGPELFLFSTDSAENFLHMMQTQPG